MIKKYNLIWQYDQIIFSNTMMQALSVNGQPCSEILHEIEDYFRKVKFYPIIRDQIKTILECVPSIFPENWKSPKTFSEFNLQEAKAYFRIEKSGLRPCRGPVIQKVIELAIEYRNRYSTKRN